MSDGLERSSRAEWDCDELLRELRVRVDGHGLDVPVPARRGAWGACSSPMEYSSLANGSHTFGVRASDAAGNQDGSSATRTWAIAATSPDPDPGKNCMADPSVWASQMSRTPASSPGSP